MDVLERNAVRVLGGGPGVPLVMAHGFGCDQGMWRHVWPAFSDDHPVVLFDHVGAGASDGASYAARHDRLDGFADDLVDVLDRVGAGPWVFVGHSVAAMMGVLAAARRPDLFRLLVLVGPNPRYVADEGYPGVFTREEVDDLLDTMDGNYLGWSAQLAPVIVGRPDRPELGEELTSSFCRTDPDLARRFARTTFLSDNRADLAAVTTPCVVLQTREDAIAPYEVGAWVTEHLPQARLVLLDTTGHCPNLSAPDLVVAAVRAALLDL